jgi:hypothetical protein
MGLPTDRIHAGVERACVRAAGRLGWSSPAGGSDDRRLVVDHYRDMILRPQDLISADLSAWLR